jgi:hypothetical protein
VTACDIHPEAGAFLREKLGVAAVGSVEVPEKFNLGQRFDVVFALSFFSHLPHSGWRRWLLALAEHTGPDGILIFTTHGERGDVDTWHRRGCSCDDLRGQLRRNASRGHVASGPATVSQSVIIFLPNQLRRLRARTWRCGQTRLSTIFKCGGRDHAGI